NVCKIAPREARHWFELGLVQQRLRRPADALHAYMRAQEIDPDFPHLRNNLAATYIELKQAHRAIEILEPFVAKSPNNRMALIILGGAYRETFQIERSLGACERAIAAEPNNLLAYNNCGLTMKELQRWEDARTMFEHALAIDPNSVGVRWNLAM